MATIADFGRGGRRGRRRTPTALDARVEELRRRFPRAIVDRYLALLPAMGARVLIAPGAAVVGDVRLADDVSVWYGCVLRGDLAPDHRRRADQRAGRDGPARRRRRSLRRRRRRHRRPSRHAARLPRRRRLPHRHAGDGARRRRHRRRLGRRRRRAGHPADGDPAPQPGAGRPRQGGQDADRRRGEVPPRPRRQVRPPERELPPRRAPGRAGALRRGALGRDNRSSSRRASR